MHRSVMRGGGKARDLKAWAYSPAGTNIFFKKARANFPQIYIKEIFQSHFNSTSNQNEINRNENASVAASNRATELHQQTHQHIGIASKVTKHIATINVTIRHKHGDMVTSIMAERHIITNVEHVYSEHIVDRINIA